MERGLPNGYVSRPGTPEDIPDLARLGAAYTTALYGRSFQTEGELRTEWNAPTFHPETDSCAVIAPDGHIVGWVEVYDFAPHVRLPSRLRLSPEDIPPSVGEELVNWSIARGRRAIDFAPPGTRVSVTQGAFEADGPANARLLAAGFEPIRTFLRMQIEMSAPPSAPRWPEGIEVRKFVAGQDDVPALEVSREVFRDHWGHVETPFEDDLAEWREWIYEDEDFDTDLWWLAFDGDRIVGFCQGYPVAGDDPRIGLVDELGVLRSHRGRGLATALLRTAFAEFHRRGKTIVELGVDAESLTGATRLYEKVGMKLVRRTNLYEFELRPGEDIANRC